MAAALGRSSVGARWHAHRDAGLLVLLVVCVAACQSPSPSPSAPSPGASAVTGASTGPGFSTPTGTAPAPASTPPAGNPAGAKFGDLVELPTTSMWSTRLFASADGGHVIIPGRRVERPGATSQPRLAIRGADGAWTDKPFDVDKGIDQPSGFPKNTSGVRVEALAFGVSGMVAIGWNEFLSSADDPTYRSAAWFSVDGATWQRTDLGDAVGNRGFTATTVAAVADGYLVVGQTTNAAGTDPASLLVLGSADGRHWTKRAAIAGTWALGATRIAQVGDHLVIAGKEFACNADPNTFGGPIQGAQLRVWSSTDRGTSWAAADVDASGVTSAKPMPTTNAGCPKSSDPDYRSVLGRDFQTRGSVLGIEGGRLVLIAADGARTASTADFAAWTSGDLPGGFPSGSPLSNVVIRALGADECGLFLVSLEAPRNAQDQQVPSADLQAIDWRSADGAAWTRLALHAKPVTLDSNTAALYAEPWGEVILVTFSPAPIDTTGETGWAHVRSSSAQP
jgi:hypothetical protein